MANNDNVTVFPEPVGMAASFNDSLVFKIFNSGRTGNVVTTDQISNSFKITTAGDHEFALGVKLVGFSAKYESEFKAPETEEIVFKVGGTGYFE